MRFDPAGDRWYLFASARNVLDTDYVTQAFIQTSPGYPANYEVGFGWRSDAPHCVSSFLVNASRSPALRPTVAFSCKGVGENTVIIRSSLDSAERIVHMDMDSHEGAQFTNQGHSIGRWDGEALVVETARFEARLNGNAFKLPSGRRKRLLERFEMSDDRTGLIYRIALEDPEYLAERVSGEELHVGVGLECFFGSALRARLHASARFSSCRTLCSSNRSVQPLTTIVGC